MLLALVPSPWVGVLVEVVVDEDLRRTIADHLDLVRRLVRTRHLLDDLRRHSERHPTGREVEQQHL